METRAKRLIGNDPPPVIRANKDDINCAFGLIASLQEIKKAERAMPRRFRAIRNGWRNVRMIETVLSNMIDDLLQTYPLEKLVSMQRMMPHMTFNLHCGVSASKLNEHQCIVTEKDLDTLAIFAHDQCKLCIDQQCSRCPLGKAFDSILTEDRDGRSWANIDIERRCEG